MGERGGMLFLTETVAHGRALELRVVRRGRERVYSSRAAGILWLQKT
jgi:hypothetical protein